ncbi:MAG: hypothetical protein QM759_10150 [Terricaulis sp.]
MIRKIATLVAAAALAATAVAPTASARDYYRHGGGYYGHGYYGHGYYGHHGDAAAAGAIGLVFGLVLGSALASSASNDHGCYSPCRYDPPPPPPQYRGYDPGRGGPPAPSTRDGSAYEEDYGIDPKLDGGPEAQSCLRQERQWDRYTQRYVTVNVPC